MKISFDELRILMKSLEPAIMVYRDEAPTNATYPYIIYEFVNEYTKRASGSVLYEMPLYQIAFITDDTERALKPLKDALKNSNVYYELFTGAPYDENDSKITQFITYVRCVNG